PCGNVDGFGRAISMALADPSPSYRANLKRRKNGQVERGSARERGRRYIPAWKRIRQRDRMGADSELVVVVVVVKKKRDVDGG
ncbi:hypothetical protein COCCADRAFT_95971, partial [Bipolaris zeicola 26-R-13]